MRESQAGGLSGQAMTPSAVRWSQVAGLAWLVALALSFVGLVVLLTAHSASLADFVATLLINLVFDVLTLLLGLRLVRRPTRTVLLVSVALALFSAVSWGSTPPGLEVWFWLPSLPVAVAGLASLAGLIVARRGQPG